MVTDIRHKAIHISKDIAAMSIDKREVGRVGEGVGWGEGVGGFIDTEPTAFFPPRFSYSTTVHHGCCIILTVCILAEVACQVLRFEKVASMPNSTA